VNKILTVFLCLGVGSSVYAPKEIDYENYDKFNDVNYDLFDEDKYDFSYCTYYVLDTNSKWETDKEDYYDDSHDIIYYRVDDNGVLYLAIGEGGSMHDTQRLMLEIAGDYTFTCLKAYDEREGSWH
jgi:hypothetical protein